jgi:hypothetical protein
MKTTIIIAITLALAAGPLYGAGTEQPLPPPSSEDLNAPPPTPPEEMPEVLTRGPVHESFAEPVNLQVQEGLVAPTQPPPNIEETPPAEKPQGEQYIWVPGYWSWDEDRNSYIWVNGCWRVAPPNMYWVPGYWTQVSDGWEWVAGFWAPVAVKEIEYLPAPPAFEDVQPPVPPPSSDNIWVPPCQYWYQGQYVPRSGYWLMAYPGWVWVPSHYVWTPRGYIFVAGYWDYSLERRGVLFAPVYFPRSVYIRPGFSYCPSIVIDIGLLRFSLFTRPRYCHYYFGDYYDDAYLSVGIYPWFECERFHTWYDPIYVHDRWRHHKTEPQWAEHERHDYQLRRDNKDLRPPRTYHEMETREARLPEPQRRNLQVARPLAAVVAASKETPQKFEHINTKARQKLTTQTTAVHKFRDERIQWESTSAGRKTVQPPTERKGPATPLTEHKGPVVSPPTELKGPVTPLTEHKGPVSLPVEQKGSLTPPTERTPAFVSPRSVRVTEPEKVKIPKSPIVGKPADSGKPEARPPANPDNERQRTGDTRGRDRGRARR